MNHTKKILTIVFAAFLLTIGLTYEASAQRRVVRRPVIVRNYVYRDPFWSSRYYWGSPFYNSYYYSPYLRAQEERYYLRRELEGNERELAKHREKYSRDGVITAKERRELEDDIRDVQRSRQRLRNYRY